MVPEAIIFPHCVSHHTELLPGHCSDVVDEQCRGYGFCVTSVG